MRLIHILLPSLVTGSAFPPSPFSESQLSELKTLYDDAIKKAIGQLKAKEAKREDPKYQVLYVHLNPPFGPKLNGVEMSPTPLGTPAVSQAGMNPPVSQAGMYPPVPQAGMYPPVQQHPTPCVQQPIPYIQPQAVVPLVHEQPVIREPVYVPRQSLPPVELTKPMQRPAYYVYRDM